MSANKERTFIMIKPDGVQRGLVGEIISRFEAKGFKLVALKMKQVCQIILMSLDSCTHHCYCLQADEELLKQHYADLSSKPFFPGLVKYMQMGPVVPMVSDRSYLLILLTFESPGVGGSECRADWQKDAGRN